MVFGSTPYRLQLLQLSKDSHDKGNSDLFFLLFAALRWRDGNGSWITISVRLASSRLTGGFLFRRGSAVLGRRLNRVLRLRLGFVMEPVNSGYVKPSRFCFNWFVWLVVSGLGPKGKLYESKSGNSPMGLYL